ncbi:MAG TPA: T9SS type A sorting domain-containing protein [Chitinophagaceae bacterium]|nr:T9SS type A sorting domain-containing protein [Chitinophagaceae bacterium]
MAGDTLITVPLGLSTKQDGWLHFTAADIANLPAGWYVYLQDKLTGTHQNLRSQPVYKALLKSGVYENRFVLQFSRRDLAIPAANNNADWKAYYAAGKLFINAGLPAGEKASITLSNMLGQVVGHFEAGGNQTTGFPLPLPVGVYIVYMEGTALHQSKKIVISQ